MASFSNARKSVSRHSKTSPIAENASSSLSMPISPSEHTSSKALSTTDERRKSRRAEFFEFNSSGNSLAGKENDPSVI